MNIENQKRLIAAGQFKENNGRVLRTINILRTKYNALKNIKYALVDVYEDEIVDAVNYLHEAGYIYLRTVDTKTPASLSDFNFKELEAKLTAKGISFLAGETNDSCIIL